MRKHGRFLLAAAAATAALGLTAGPAAAKTINLTIADSNDVQTVQVGDVIRVTLPANQTTPYHWKVTTKPKRSVAKITKAKYVGSTTGVPGSPGKQIYVIKAVGQGRTRMVAEYQEISTGATGGKDSTMVLAIVVR
jgi:inhibitor of cysteine peptidase